MDVRGSQPAMCRPTNGTLADGEIVWSWHPDADAKRWRVYALSRDGGQKARRTEEITYKP